MAFPEQFALRWNDFVSNVTSSFHNLLEQKDMVDVTLAADGQCLYAHKLILSISSPYFKELFKTNPCEHPIVILKDVKYQEMDQLLQFMYYGEVRINRQDLSKFLHTAEMLQVKGLCSPSEPAVSPEPSDHGDDQIRLADPVEPGPFAPAAPAATPEVTTNETFTEPTAVKQEPRSPLRRLLKNSSPKNKDGVKRESRSPVTSSSPSENSSYNPDNEPVIDFDNDMFPAILVPDTVREAGWNCGSPLVKGVKCPNCHRFFANRYNLKVHIRDKHDTKEGTLQCEICKKRMRNPSCLRVHMYHHRKQAAYLAQFAPDGIHKAQVPTEGSDSKLTLVSSLWSSSEGPDSDSYSSQSKPNMTSDETPKSESDLEEV